MIYLAKKPIKTKFGLELQNSKKNYEFKLELNGEKIEGFVLYLLGSAGING